MLRLIPRGLHRAALRVAHKARHRWRVLRKVPLAGVSVIATDMNGRVLLVRHSYGPDHWALPGGGLKRGESAQSAAQREMMEEVGCLGSDLHVLGSQDEIISGSPHTAHVVAMTIEGDLRPDRREVIEAEFFALDALPDTLGSLTRARLELWRSSSVASDQRSGE